jgi:hypothetical protein
MRLLSPVARASSASAARTMAARISCTSFLGLAHFITPVVVSSDCIVSASVLRDCRNSSRTRRRSAFLSRVKRPCLSAFLFPSGAPDPGAPPCIRQRLSVAATLHGVVFQFFRSRLNLSVLASFAIETAAIVQLMATAPARVP